MSRTHTQSSPALRLWRSFSVTAASHTVGSERANDLCEMIQCRLSLRVTVGADGVLNIIHRDYNAPIDAYRV
jgi:hypothetical protein